MNEIVHQESMRFLLQGGRWGENLEYAASERLLSIKSEQGRVHPILELFKTIPFDFPEDGYEYVGPWHPSHMLQTKVGTNWYVDRSSPSQEDLTELQAAFDEYHDEYNVDVHDERVRYQWVQGFNVPSAYRVNKVRIGDDVSVNFEDSLEYIRIHKCLQVTFGTRRFCFIFPLWYHQYPKKGLIPVVSKWAGNSDPLIPLPSHTLVEQVFVLHDCQRKCICRQHICSCLICKPQDICILHATATCNTCDDFSTEDIHEKGNNSYLVFTSALGFQPDF